MSQPTPHMLRFKSGLKRSCSHESKKKTILKIDMVMQFLKETMEKYTILVEEENVQKLKKDFAQLRYLYYV